MAELPTDIIIKILSKLPVKSLLRFQCVSKSWKSLIKSPNFIKIHLNQTLTSYSNRHLLVSVEYSSLHSSEFDLTNNPPSLCFSALNPPHEKFHFVGTYNGVVCISSISKRENFLFNPLTNSCHKLPSAEIPIPEFNMTLLGFGYDRNNDDYKVLKIFQGLGKLDDSKNKAQVYSLKNNSWKCIQGIPYALYHGYYDGVLVNDYLHYVVTHEPSSEHLLIASFDLLTESFSHMECPDYDDQFTSFHSVFTLVELGGCLCLLINFYGNDEMLFDDDDDDLLDELDARVLKCVELWVMKEYGKKESWVRLFAIRHPETMGSSRVIRPVVYSEDGRRILLEIDVLRYGWYDLESKNFDSINAHGLPKGLINTKVFIGSLVSLEVEDKLLSQKEAVPMKNNKKKNVDNFLSDGFKLKL